MAKCPNRNRNRIGPGGGSPGCPGSLEVVVTVALSLGAKRVPKGGQPLESVLKARDLAHAHKVTPAQIVHAIKGGQADLVCPVCGWSMKRLAIRPRKGNR